MLKYHIYLSQSYAEVYMMTSCVFYVEPLCVHLQVLHPVALLAINPTIHLIKYYKINYFTYLFILFCTMNQGARGGAVG